MCVKALKNIDVKRKKEKKKRKKKKNKGEKMPGLKKCRTKSVMTFPMNFTNSIHHSIVL